jgi:hypothetical protein
MLEEKGYKFKPCIVLEAGMSIGDVVRANLIPASLAKWVKEEKAEIRKLRQEYDKQPYNALDADYDSLLESEE